MAIIEYAAIGMPIAADDPCGADLDFDGDADFLQFMARVEYLLPQSFFSHDEDGLAVPFDRSTIDFKTEFASLSRLLKSTRDLRLLTLCCRLHALDRDLTGCADGLGAIAGLLAEHWDAVHPRAEAGDFGYRLAILQALDDAPTMISPLQHLPLFANRRFGPISLRIATVASGAVQPRAGEGTLDASDLDRTLRDADPAELDLARDGARRIRHAALSITATTAKAAGEEVAVRLDRLVAMADGIMAFLGGTDVPAAASTPSPEAAATRSSDNNSPGAQAVTVVGAVADFASAKAALAAVIGYFDAYERSNPAALLARQAERLIGLPFHEVIRLLLPKHAEEASIHIGPTPERSFEIRLDRMTELLGEGGGDAEQDPDDAVTGDAAVAGPAESGFVVASRAEAVALLRQIGGFYRLREPASPVPLFVDRACAMADKDFLMILSDVLPGVRLSRAGD